MSTHFLKQFFSSSDHEDIPIIQPVDTRIDLECREFLPEVYDTWTLVHKLSTDTTHFREIYDLYKYERSENEQKNYFNQLKILDDNIYKLSLTIHQHIQLLEKIIQPTIEDYRNSMLNNQEMDNYIPAYVRIAQNQLNCLKSSFKRIIIKHNSDSIDYQNNLKQSLENSSQKLSPLARNKIQTLLNTDDEPPSSSSQEQIQLQINEEQQITDLQIRLESIKILKDRVRDMNEMTMALYFSVQDQNELTDNIWLNTSAGSDYITQSVDEFHLVKTLKQSKINLWMKLICITCCFLFILLFLLTLILILNQK